MKINDILECINKVLVEERKIKNLPEVLGHFVFHLNWEKNLGTIKTFHAYIDFINMKEGAPYTVVSETCTMDCPVDRLDEMKEVMTKKTLTRFFKVLRLGEGKLSYENFVNRDFQGWN